MATTCPRLPVQGFLSKVSFATSVTRGFSPGSKTHTHWTSLNAHTAASPAAGPFGGGRRGPGRAERSNGRARSTNGRTRSGAADPFRVRTDGVLRHSAQHRLNRPVRTDASIVVGGSSAAVRAGVASRNLRHATCVTQLASRNLRHATCVLGGPPGPRLCRRPPCSGPHRTQFLWGYYWAAQYPQTNCVRCGPEHGGRLQQGRSRFHALFGNRGGSSFARTRSDASDASDACTRVRTRPDACRRVQTRLFWVDFTCCLETGGKLIRANAFERV